MATRYRLKNKQLVFTQKLTTRLRCCCIGDFIGVEALFFPDFQEDLLNPTLNPGTSAHRKRKSPCHTCAKRVHCCVVISHFFPLLVWYDLRRGIAFYKTWASCFEVCKWSEMSFGDPSIVFLSHACKEQRYDFSLVSSNAYIPNFLYCYRR